MSDSNSKHKQEKRNTVGQSVGKLLCSTSLVVLAGAMTSGIAQAQALWDGSASQTWSNGANWDTNTVPTAGTDVTVRHGTPNAPHIDGEIAKAKTLTIGTISGLATLDITNGGTLTSSGAILASTASGQGLITLAGAGSSWTDTAGLQIGQAGEGLVRLGTGALLKTDNASLGAAVGSSGVVEVDGAGTVWTNNTSLTIGKGGVGGVKVTKAGQVTSGDIRLSDQATSTYSTLTIDGTGSSVAVASGLQVGVQGIAKMAVSNGAKLASGLAELGYGAGAEGAVDVEGSGSTWTNAGALTIGNAGRGLLAVFNGGHLSSGLANLAVQAGSSAEVGINGAGSTWTVTQQLRVGVRGEAKLYIDTGGVVTSQSGAIGYNAGSQGTVAVHGAGAAWVNTDNLQVGFGGTGTLSIANGGSVSSAGGSLGGGNNGSSGAVTVAGTGSQWLNSDGLTVGSFSEGLLEISAGGEVSNTNATLGFNAAAKGTVTVKDAGSKWTGSSYLTVGSVGQGFLNVLDGGQVKSKSSVIASETGSLGNVQVIGANSRWDITQSLTVGYHGKGEIGIKQGGALTNAAAEIGVEAGSVSMGFVDGVGSTWTSTGALSVAVMGQAFLNVSNGGAVSSVGATIGAAAGSKGVVVVKDAGSKWTNAASLVIGDYGQGTISLTYGGRMTVASDIVIAQQTGSVGTLIIGKDTGDAAAGQLTAPRIRFGAGNGALLFNHTDTNYVLGAIITGKGTIEQRQGSTTYTGSGNAFTGTTTVSGGTLRVNGTLGGTVNVQSGGTLGGSGTLGGAITVASSGTLLGQSGQTLTMGGLTLGSGTNVDVSLGAPGNATGLFNVGGNLTLDGTLNVTDAGGFGQGVYRIIDYAGTLTDNGMIVGTMPVGTGTIQTAVANRVNLVVDTGGPVSTMQFWNGTTTTADGTIHGGNGTWSAGPVTNWTNSAGSAAAAWGGNFAVFQNNPGTVTVDGSAGMVSTTGMQFIGSGWSVAGASVTLAGAGGSTTIRVGDGTMAGTGFTATIASALTGTSRLVKDDLGTLVLTGANSYSGGTLVAAGVLQGSSASLQGDIVNNATVVFEQSADGTYGGSMSGSGALTKTGAGMLILAGTNGYTGGTTVDGGILQGNAASLQGAIVNNASVVFDQATDGIYAGAMSGSGNLTKSGAGNLTLTGANSYSGGTTVSGGTLIGTTASLQGAIVNNASVVFDQATGGIYAGAMSGTGSLTKTGAGNLILSGANSYTGGTVVSGGTLTGTTTSLQGNVLNNASVVFDQSTDGTYAGAMSGTGALVKSGTGAVTLTGNNSYTGGTTVMAGTLIGNATSLQGNILNNAAVVFDQASNGTYAGNMTGSGSLTKSGAGVLSLTGTSVVGGGTTVSGGVLAVNGSLTSNVTVTNGGALGGSGQLIGAVAVNGGTLAPGNSIGTLNVTGTFSQTGGVYQVEANTQGQSDKIVATGTATIGGGATVQVLAASGTYQRNTTYTILTATGGLTGTYSGVSSNLAFLTPSLSYDANNVYLLLAQTASAFASGAQTANQYAVGTALDIASPTATGDFNTVLNALAGLSTQQGPAALNTISGQPYAGFGSMNVLANQLFMNTLGQQIALARTGGPGAIRVALAEACQVACDTQEAPRWGAWFSGLGGAGGIGGNANAGGLTYNFGGAAVGVDYRLDPRFLVGLAFGYSSGRQWVSGFQGTGTTDTYSVALYGSFNQGGFYADALAGYAYGDNRLQRVMQIPGLATRYANGGAGANQFLGQIEAGYKIGFGLSEAAQASITPFARFQTVAASQQGFSEWGAQSLNLQVQQQNTTSVRTVLGVDLAASLPLGSERSLGVTLRLGWAHDYADTTRPMTAAFAGAPAVPFTVYGAQPMRDAAVIGLGLSTQIASSTQLYLRYDGELNGRDDNHTFSAGLRMTW